MIIFWPTGQGAGPAGSADYPAVGNVRDGITYSNGSLVGTLTLPAESDVRLGIDYGASGTEFEGTLVTPSTAGGSTTDHSPADIARWLLIALGYANNPATADATWPGFTGSEPTDPDNCITTYDTTGSDHGRDMPTGTTRGHAGFQIRIRATTHTAGWQKANAIRTALEGVYQRIVHADAATYIVQSVVKIGDVLTVGKDRPNSGRSVFTLNALLVYKQA